MLLEPLLHERYGPIATPLVDLFHEVVEDGLVPSGVSFGATSFAHIERRDTPFIVGPYPVPYGVRTYRKVPYDLCACCAFLYVANYPYTCFLRFIVRVGKRVTKFRYTVAGAQGQCCFHTYSMRPTGEATQWLVVDGIILKQPRNWVMRSASLGRTYANEEIDTALREKDVQIEWKVSSDITRDTAKLIKDGKIIGWFQGGSEYGPRALGNRSILCDASKKDMRDVLNARVKHREMWRPFATSILTEKLEEWFEIKPNFATRFMLLAAEIPESKRKLVPSIVHVDNTCRMQTLSKEDNGVYYDLVKEFEKLTGIPLVLNTSFNLGGEPIVETPRDALNTFLKTDMDFLVLENRVAWKRS